MKHIPGSEILDEDEPAEKPKRLDKFAKMEQDFLDQFVSAGASLAFLSPEDGAVILEHSDSLSQRLVGLARQNPKVYAAFKRYLEGSVYLLLGQEVATIAFAIMANHGINPIAKLIEKRAAKNAASASPTADSDLQSVA